MKRRAAVWAGGLALLGLCWARCSPAPPDPPDPRGLDVEPLVEQRIVEATAAVRAQPESAEAWGRLGVIYDIHRLGDRALPCYDRAASLDPEDWRWPYFIGLTHRESDQQAALRAFERAVELRPDYPPLRFYLGYGYLLSER
ncbi:MAG TPA: hypothetical protein VD788_00005, partial [Candidatus Polarisedimenticolaceae bacterium]|nr:hypothetical protein [Candidatus Polarisedimenticolaceae bacterium]